MLVQYTSLSSLTPEEQARLKNQVRNMNAVPTGHFQFEGKTLQAAEVARQKRIWENGAGTSGPQVLLG